MDDELIHHDRQDDTAKGGARDHDAIRGGALLEKPGDEARHAGIEDGAGADGGDEGLCKEYLVVFFGE